MSRIADQVIDVNLTPDPGVPLWNETRWNACWNPDAGVGIYVHAGRLRQALDWWWVQTVAYLPDGLLAVDRCWTRNSAAAGVRTENLEHQMTATGWTSSFDGVCEITSVAALARAPRGSSAPSAPVRWQVQATNASPEWDLYSTVQDSHDFASDLHLQQGSRTRGALWVAGEEYPLDGVGFKDHSCGARTWERWHSHRFLLAVMPHYTLHAAVIAAPDGTPTKPLGALMTRGEQSAVNVFDMPPLHDAAGAPVVQTMTVTTPAGPTEIIAELVHGFPITITEANDNLNGIDWEIDGDPIVLVEGIVRLTEPDGTSGHAFLERSARRSTLSPPQATATPRNTAGGSDPP